MEDILPATENLGHGHLYGNLTLDKLKSNWKGKRGSGGSVNSSEGCWRRSGKSFSSSWAGQWSDACRAEEGLSRVEKEEVVLMCCEHRGKWDLPQRNLGQGAAFQPGRLLADRGCVSGLQRTGSPGTGALCDLWKLFAFVVFSSKQQTIASFCSAVQDGRQPHLPKV